MCITLKVKKIYIYKEIQKQLLKCIKTFEINIICYINIKYYQKSKIKKPYLRKILRVITDLIYRHIGIIYLRFSYSLMFVRH